MVGQDSFIVDPHFASVPVKLRSFSVSNFFSRLQHFFLAYGRQNSSNIFFASLSASRSLRTATKCPLNAILSHIYSTFSFKSAETFQVNENFLPKQRWQPAVFWRHECMWPKEVWYRSSSLSNFFWLFLQLQVEKIWKHKSCLNHVF